MSSSRPFTFLPSPLYPIKAAAVTVRSVAWLLRTAGCPSQSGIRILFYHRVSDDSDPLAVPPRRFRAQMDFLAANGYEVVDVVEAARLLERHRPYRPVIAVTFDDGYLDVAQNVLPVLAEHGFRATVFVATGALDGTSTTFGCYRRCPPLLSWNQVVELDNGSPFRFEAHSVTHPNLMTLSPADARRELVDSKRALEDRLARRVLAFSYPGGVFGERERRLAQEAGYEVAVSCQPGVNGPQTDRMALRRTQIDPRHGLLDFRAAVGGGHDRPLPLRSAYRRLRYGVA
jgi:peptidoglycan/xylan/chitin deacetylase (PgdA/CDA1 family)